MQEIYKKLKSKVESFPYGNVKQSNLVTYPIWIYDFSDLVNNDKLLSCIFEHQTLMDYKHNWPESGNIFHCRHTPLLYPIENKNENLKELFLRAEQKVSEIWEQLGPYHKAYTFLLQQYLFSIYQKDEYIEWHAHGITELVGTYYAKVPAGSSNIIFLDANHKEFEIKVKEGMCIFFPGKAVHKINPSQHEGERIIITMNFWFNYLKNEFKKQS